MPVAVLLESGSKGDDVTRVQSELAAQGFDPGPIDGDFRELTGAAVRRFQAAHGLLVDGVVGPETLLALEGANATLTVAGTLVDLGLLAERDFGLAIGECSAPGAPGRWGPVHDVHAAHSFHTLGRAFDASGPAEEMRRFAAFVTDNFAGLVAELIHNPNGSIKNGSAVDTSFWGDTTFSAHANHVHLAI